MPSLALCLHCAYTSSMGKRVNRSKRHPWGCMFGHSPPSVARALTACRMLPCEALLVSKACWVCGLRHWQARHVGPVWIRKHVTGVMRSGSSVTWLAVKSLRHTVLSHYDDKS